MASHRSKLSLITALVIVSLLFVNFPVAALAGTATGNNAASAAAGVTRQPSAPNVTATVGTGGTYLTLKAAFDDINSGVLTDTVQLDIIGDTTETVPAVLNASGSGSASYTSVLIQPSGGAWTISGAIAAGSPLIDLNGADNVTIDGLNTGGNALTIANTTASATSGTSTIRFQADATNNTLTNLSILGSGSMAVGTNGGNIWFGAAAISTGNDNNTVSNNIIGPAGTNLPTKGIYFNGSTTTAALNNSGIVVTGNNIYDYFGAAVSSAGIYVSTGNTDNTFSSNKFYQTATRTQTTGAQHSAIWIANTSGNNFQITGNTIGYASNSGTGTYNFVGFGTTSRFIAIYLNIGSITASSVQGNTITAINISGVTGGTSTTSAFMGVSVPAGLATIGNITGNTIGSLTAAGAISLTNNTSTAFEVYGVYYFPSAASNISNNAVGGLELTNNGTAALTFYGLRAFTTSSVVNMFSSNMVGAAAAPIVNTSSSTSSRTIGLYSQSGIAAITGNTVRYLTMNAGNAGTGSSASLIGLWVDASSAPGHTVSRNTVYALSNTNATAAVWVTGLQYNGTTGTNVVARNSIYNLSTPSTSATATVNGINVQGGTTTYQNNMVVLGNEMTANSPQINGINEAVAGTDNFYFNSVYVGGADVAAGTANSFAFFSSITTNTRNYLDNIFFNARRNGAATGKHYAIRVGGTTANPAGLTSNNNVITATGTGGYVGLFNTVDQATLANWRTATGQDAASFDLDPQFIAPAAATPDLHISTVVTTAVESNGFPIAAVTDDFDGDVRANFTPTDIGADAGNFIGVDLAGPTIVYTPFGNTSLTTDRLLAATIADATGVPTSGTQQPRLYYNKNGGTWYSSQGALVTGTGLNGTWNFTLTVSDVGGVTAGDVISYFVIAEDTASPINLASNPAGAVASDVNTITTPPTPNTYTIVPSFSGSYNVGATEVYTSLTNAGGLFQAINAGALSGNVIVNITSDLTGESGTVALNQWSEDGAGGYTMLIRPTGVFTVTGSNIGALIRFFSTDRLTLDGSSSGGTDRSLTIQNTNTGTSAVVIAVQSGANGAQNNTIKNVNILGQDPTTTLAGLALGGTTPGTAGTDNDNNRVENNAVRRAIYGIYASGQNATNPNEGTVITGNDLTGSGADRIRRVGILVFNENGIQITDNTLAQIETNESADAIGIGVGIQSIDATTTTGGGVTNAVVARNRINGVNSSSTTGFSAAGIAVAGVTGGANTIANNMVLSVTAPSTSPDLVAGIFVAGVTGSDTQLFFNSVSMTGDRGAVATQMPSYGLAATGVNPTMTLRNNIFHTTQTASGGGVNAKSYAIGLVSTTFTNLESNYNLFYASGANVGYFRTGSLGAGAGTDYGTLTAWQTAVSDDVNSLFGNPQYISATDLHLQATSPAIGAGTPIAGITTDIDGDSRSATNPSSGADEGPAVVPVTFIYNDLEDAVSSTDNLYVDGLLGFGNPQVMAADGGAEVFSVTLSLTRNLPLQYKYVVNTFDGYGYDLLNNPNINRVITITAASTINDYRRISQYDYYALLSPANATVWLGNPSPSVLGELYINNLTAAAGALPGLRAQVGFGQSTDPSTWTWVEAPYTGQAGNNDQYAGVFTPTLTGVYSYAVRFNANWGATNPNNAWKYGGLGFAPLANDLSNAGVLTVTVPVGYGVIQTPASAAQNGNPGAVVTYTLTVTNTGNTSDSYAISITGATWSTVATPTTVGPLAAGASTTVQVQVTVPANAAASASDVATVTATSLGDASQTASSALTTTANQVYGVIQTPASSAQNGNPGAVVTYTFTLTNTGNSSDSYAISITGATWSTVANPTTVGPVAAGASATVQVQVTVPSNAVDGTSDTATVTATSQGDNTQSASSTATTTVQSGCQPIGGLSFTTSPTAPRTGQSVQFTASVATGTLPVTYTWDFGDSGTGNGSPVNHTFPAVAAATAYTVTLTASNTCSSQAQVSQVIVVNPHTLYLPLIWK